MNSTLTKSKPTKYVARMLFIGALLGSYQSVSAQTAFPADAKDSCNKHNFKAGMTKISLPPIKGKSYEVGPFYDRDSGLVYVFPANGPDFSSQASNCDFFRWAAQMFLWTTSTVSDSTSVPKTPSAPSSMTPYVFNSEFFYRYSDGVLSPQNADGPGNSFALRTLKFESASPEAGVAQAGGSGVLLSQSGNKVSSKESLVYYGVHSNRVLGYVAQENLAAGGGKKPYTEFPSDAKSVCDAIAYGMKNGYAKSSPVESDLYSLFCPKTPIGRPLHADIASNLELGSVPRPSIPELEPAIDYFSMAMELKTSWVNSESLNDKGKYILQTANVPVYTKKTKTDGTVFWKKTSEQSQELALVGMHIVGTVEGHPEMIWATIEHVNNAPNAKYHYVDSKGELGTHTPDYDTKAIAKTESNWLFSNGTNKKQNLQKAVLCKEGICPTTGQEIAPSNVVRTHPWGVDGANKNAFKISSELISLNRNVFGALKEYNAAHGGKPAIDDPRENYFVSGANWGAHGKIPTSFTSTGSGSTHLANTTLETFNQDVGCFGCHSAYQPTKSSTPKDMTTSHIFGQIKMVQKLED